jgi:hypothetical protein
VEYMHYLLAQYYNYVPPPLREGPLTVGVVSRYISVVEAVEQVKREQGWA